MASSKVRTTESLPGSQPAEIIATEPQIEAVCYGTAMLLSLSEGETEQNRLFTQIYNAKRAAVLSEIQKIQDSLPTVSYGVD